LAGQINRYRVGSAEETFVGDIEAKQLEKAKYAIEPWLSAVFQSEHLSLLIGSGFTAAAAHLAGISAANMGRIPEFQLDYERSVNEYARRTAEKCGRGEANIEDQIRAIHTLTKGLEVIGDSRAALWKQALNGELRRFLVNLLQTEQGIRRAVEAGGEKGSSLEHAVSSFLMSFAGRAASRERLHIFTTNYDRLIEYAGDLIGLRIIDRFVGSITPIYRSSRIEVDLYYNPPGIRGEPRYLEGVVKMTKLHGSLDWKFERPYVKRYPIPFGAPGSHTDLSADPLEKVMIYPNPAKDVETSEYPYADLFRDFSAALCRPNSVLVTYGYGFGDDHINRVLHDMLTIPSTHLVIISYDDASGRVTNFCQHAGKPAQISLLLGNHFGDLQTLTKHYLPKPAIDYITARQARVIEQRTPDYLHRWKRAQTEKEKEETEC
jgi:hypothetical protein